jgi:hypothetical protein
MAEEETPRVAELVEAPPATAAITRILDRAAANKDLSPLVDLLRDAYNQDQWASRHLTIILEQVAVGEGAQQ